MKDLDALLKSMVPFISDKSDYFDRKIDFYINEINELFEKGENMNIDDEGRFKNVSPIDPEQAHINAVKLMRTQQREISDLKDRILRLQYDVDSRDKYIDRLKQLIKLNHDNQ